MNELHRIILRNTDENNNDNSTIRRVLIDIEQLISMLSNEFDQNKISIISNLNNFSPQRSKITTSRDYSLSSSTITNVTINDNNHQIIEHLRNRIIRLEHERNVLLTSYQLLIKLLK